MKVICYGDSNTYGYDPRLPFGGRYDRPWPELLAEKTGWNVINLGENGLEIPNGTAAFPADTDLLIIMLGTNDLLQFRTPESAANKMERFVLGLPFSGAKILLLAPPPMVFGAWVYDQELIDDVLALGECYKALAERLGVGFANVDCCRMLSHDGVHLTEAGHRAFADCLYDLLTKENSVC